MKNKLITLIILIGFTSSAYSDEYVDPILDCCSQNSRKLEKQITNQEKILTELENINNSILFARDTTIAKIEITESEKESNCDLCGMLGAGLGAIISAFIALFIYRRGEKKEKSAKIEEIKDFGEDIFILTNDSVRAGKIQVNAIKEYIESLESELHKTHYLNRVPLHQLERLRSFEVDRVKKAFRQLNLTNKEFVNFYNQIDYLFEIFKAVHEDYEDSNSKFVTPMSNEFLKLRQEILMDITEFTEKLRKNGESTKDIYKFLDNLLIEYIEPINGQMIPDIKNDYDNFIFKLMYAMVTTYRDDEFSTLITKKLQRAKELYVSVIGASTHFLNTLKSRIGDIEKSTDALSVINEKLKIHYAS